MSPAKWKAFVTVSFRQHASMSFTRVERHNNLLGLWLSRARLFVWTTVFLILLNDFLSSIIAIYVHVTITTRISGLNIDYIFLANYKAGILVQSIRLSRLLNVIVLKYIRGISIKRKMMRYYRTRYVGKKNHKFPHSFSYKTTQRRGRSSSKGRDQKKKKKNHRWIWFFLRYRR